MLLDAASDRRQQEALDQFEMRVEAARLGTAFASNRRAYQGWRRRQRSRNSVQGAAPLEGQALEAAIMRLASEFPGQVVRGFMPGPQQGGRA